MRQVLTVLAFFLPAACGEVVKPATDAPPSIDASLDALPPPVPRLYALTSVNLSFSMTSKISLEVVDLKTMMLARHVDVGFAGASSMAVSPDGAVLYIADFANNEVRFVDTTTGATLHTVALSGVRDLALTPDGKKLFASANQKVVAIDTATQVATPSPNVGGMNAIALGLAVSPDGARVGTATTDGGTNPTVTLVRTSDMSIEAAIPIVTNVTGCGSSPAAVAFRSNGLLVAWDQNCDALYQVDVGTHAQLTAASIATGRDSGTSFILSSKLTLSAATSLVYAIKEDGNLAVMNPQNLTFTQIPSADTPFASVMSEDGAKLFMTVIHRFNGGAADTLDVIDTASSGVQRAAYTFSLATQSTVDMAIATSP